MFVRGWRRFLQFGKDVVILFRYCEVAGIPVPAVDGAVGPTRACTLALRVSALSVTPTFDERDDV